MSTPPATPLRFLALGDSYTIGEGVPPGERWPEHLVDGLRERGLPLDPPRIVARTGWTTDELDAALDAAPPPGPFDLVSLLIGVNDQYRGRPLDGYRAGFARLLERALGWAGGDPRRVMVLSIPDWGVTPFAAERDPVRIAGEIDRFNQANRAIVEAAGARYVDVTGASRAAGADPAMLVEDGLHPSGEQYARWAALALPQAAAALGLGTATG